MYVVQRDVLQALEEDLDGKSNEDIDKKKIFEYLIENIRLQLTKGFVKGTSYGQLGVGY